MADLGTFHFTPTSCSWLNVVETRRGGQSVLLRRLPLEDCSHGSWLTPSKLRQKSLRTLVLRLLRELGAGSDARGGGLQKVTKLQAVGSEHRRSDVTIVVYHVDRSRLRDDGDHRLVT